MKKKANKHTPQASARRRSVWGLAILLGFAAVVTVWSRREPADEAQSGIARPPSARSSEAEASEAIVPPFHQDPRSAEPFPETLSPSLFQNPVVAQAYQIAQDIPEILTQQPCYCYCDGYGHGSLLDCFADGHGAGCNVCVNEAFLAKQMTDSGKTPVEIREAIVRGDWRKAGVR